MAGKDAHLPEYCSDTRRDYLADARVGVVPLRGLLYSDDEHIPFLLNSYPLRTRYDEYPDEL